MRERILIALVSALPGMCGTIGSLGLAYMEHEEKMLALTDAKYTQRALDFALENPDSLDR